MRHQVWVCLLIITFFFLSPPLGRAQFSEAGVEKLRVTVDAPDFTLKELGGEKISLKEMRGKIVVLNFFATWCPNCRKESPSFVKLNEELKNTDLVLLRVGIKEKEQDLIKYKNEFNITSPILIDDNASVANAYGVWSHPETFFINRDGKIVGRVLREMDWTSRSTRKLIKYLMKEKK